MKRATYKIWFLLFLSLGALSCAVGPAYHSEQTSDEREQETRRKHALEKKRKHALEKRRKHALEKKRRRDLERKRVKTPHCLPYGTCQPWECGRKPAGCGLTMFCGPCPKKCPEGQLRSCRCQGIKPRPGQVCPCITKSELEACTKKPPPSSAGDPNKPSIR
jgi:hypothetical protein